MFNKMNKIKYNFFLNHGFTLVELMVVISIFLIMVGVMLFDYGSFRSNVSLQNLSDDIALAIRKTQGFAIGVHGLGTGNDFKNSNGYGIHFLTDNYNSADPLAGSKKSFLIFYDLDDDDEYDSGSGINCGESGSECVELFNIKTSDIIKSIEVFIGSGSIKLSTSFIDIIFKRPNPKAYFCTNGVCDKNITRINITISNGQEGDKEKTRTISIQNTGQISVQ